MKLILRFLRWYWNDLRTPLTAEEEVERQTFSM